MSSPAPLVAALRGLRGVTDIRSPMMAATSPASAHAARHEGDSGGCGGARGWGRGCRGLDRRRHVAQGADYIKVVIDLPGFDQETVDELVAAAACATACRSSRTRPAATRSRWPTRAGVDMLTHAPLDRPIDGGRGCRLSRRAAHVIVPTLTMMRGIVDRTAGDKAFRHRPMRRPGRRWPRSRRQGCRSLRARCQRHPRGAGVTAVRCEPARRARSAGRRRAHAGRGVERRDLGRRRAFRARTTAAGSQPGLRADLVLLVATRPAISRPAARFAVCGSLANGSTTVGPPPLGAPPRKTDDPRHRRSR